MKFKSLAICMSMLMAFCLAEAKALAYETNVHSAISKNAFNASVLGSGFLTNLGISKIDQLDNNMTALQEIQDGSIKEDEDITFRWLNHFYDPTTGQGLNAAGIPYGHPSLEWGKNYINNDWTLEKMRYYYYLALTNTVAPDRKLAFAHLFRGLGQIIHLIQDKAVPAHTRNDAHFPYSNKQRDMYERYTRDAADLTFAGYGAVELSVFNNFDTFWINGGKGLAEYTNSNFLSRDTNIDDARYALPVPIGDWNTTETSDGNQYTVRYLQGYATDNYRPGESKPISRLSVYSYMDFEMNKYGYSQRVYSLNNKIHKEYADLLIPRAVGYSAGLLNYFFRGTIDISVPTNGLYSMIDATQEGFTPAFTAIKLKATNTTTTGENMTNGTIQLVVKYKVAHADPFQPGPIEKDADFSYIVVPEKNNVSALYSASPTELNFDLSQNPIPLWATDVYLQVVFKGTLGNEENAVAVGFKDISEPTPMDLFSNTDQICISGSWYVAGSQQAIEQVDANHNGVADYPSEADVYGHDPQDIYILFSPYSETTYRIASPTFYDIKVSNLAPANHKRVMCLLSDYQFDDTSHVHWVKRDAPDNWPITDVKYLHINYAIKRQVDYSEDSGLCGGNPPCYLDYYPGESTSFPAWQTTNFFTFRGARMWWGSPQIYTNLPPAGSQCSFDLLQ
ncbi:MAG: hypothetical protein M0Z67_04870 [Nitrospiraceae bacterium]|nr:hypothetical protein [Nitrospiraceae bacterium]